MNHTTIYCNNCGNEGHLYRQCRLPVLSYGVLCINKDKLLMIQRKDSLSFIEFLRGKYDLSNEDYILRLLNTCSIKERDLISNSSFDVLWDNLWFSGKIRKKQTDRMIREYEKSKYLFNKLKETCLDSLISKCTNTYETPEWEFPKGRRSSHESNIKCAQREFEEESDLQSNEYTLLENVAPLTEEYIGSNSVRYKHIYYIGIYNGDRKLSINSDKYEQYSEIGDIEWLSISECYHKIRDEKLTKIQIIEQMDKIITNWSNDFTLN